MLTLVLGGARSGKSRHAQALAGSRSAVFIATARTGDDSEMERRIRKHRASRPPTWTTVEEPLYLAKAITRTCPEDGIAIVDCLTLWLSNVLWEHRDQDDDSLETIVLEAVEELRTVGVNRDLIVISNDVGAGLVPNDSVGRRFRDLQGLANQQLAQGADRVVWLLAGLPTVLKESQNVERGA